MSDMLTSVTDYLLRQSWQIAAVFMVVAIASWMLRRASAHWRYLLWLLVLVKCAVPPVVSVPVAVLPEEMVASPADDPHALAALRTQYEPMAVDGEAQPVRGSAAPAPTEPDSDAALYAAAAVAPNEDATTVAELSDAPGFAAIPPAASSGTEPADMATVAPVAELPHVEPASMPIRLSRSQAFALVWAAGAIVLLLLAGWKAWRIRRFVRRHRVPCPDDLQEELADLAGQLRLRSAPPVWLVEGIAQPFVWGLVRGTVYLPADFARTRSAEHRRGVLMHELAHVARLDAAVNVFQVIVQAAFFFHPLVWWTNRRIRQEREKCCDEVAIAHLGAPPRQYGEAILHSLVRQCESAQPVPSLAVAGPVRNLEERIRTIMHPNRHFHRKPSRLAIVSVVLLGILALPTALVLTARPAAAPAEADRASAEAQPQPIGDAAEQELPADTETLARLEAMRTEARARLKALEAQRAEYEQTDGHDRPVTPEVRHMIDADPQILALQLRLAQLQGERRALAETLGENHRNVHSMDTQIAEVRKTLNNLEQDLLEGYRRAHLDRLNLDTRLAQEHLAQIDDVFQQLAGTRSVEESGSRTIGATADGDRLSVYFRDADGRVRVIDPDRDNDRLRLLGGRGRFVGVGATRWTFSTGRWNLTTPALGPDGTIYVGSHDGHLYAVNPDGSLKWRYEMVARGIQPVIAADGTIYIVSGSTRDPAVSVLIAVRPDGTAAWQYELGGSVAAAPALADDGTIYVGTLKSLVAIAPDGSRRWEQRLWQQPSKEYISSLCVAGDGTIYVYGIPGELAALTPDGRTKWSAQAPAEQPSSASSGCVSAGQNGRVYIAVQHYLYAFTSEGEQQWRFRTGGQIRSEAAVGRDGTVYIGDGNGSLYAIQPNGTLVWEFVGPAKEAKFLSSMWTTPAIDANGMVYIGSWDGNLFGIMPDGREFIRVATRGGISGSPVIGPDGTIYFTTLDGKLYAVTATAGPADAPWPMAGHDARHTSNAATSQPVREPVSAIEDLRHRVRSRAEDLRRGYEDEVREYLKDMPTSEEIRERVNRQIERLRERLNDVSQDPDVQRSIEELQRMAEDLDRRVKELLKPHEHDIRERLRQLREETDRKLKEILERPDIQALRNQRLRAEQDQPARAGDEHPDEPTGRAPQIEYGQLHFVQVVVGRERVAFQGRPTTWDELPSLLERVSDRPHTVLAVGNATDDPVPQPQQWRQTIDRLHRLSRQFGFAYLSDVSSQPPGAVGEPTQYYCRGPLINGSRIPLDLKVEAEDDQGRLRRSLTVQSVQLVQDARTNQIAVHLDAELLSHPKARWRIAVLALGPDDQRHEIGHRVLESKGVALGRPLAESHSWLLLSDSLTFQPERFEIRVQPLTSTAAVSTQPAAAD